MKWSEFFTDHFIEFVTSGPLTTRGHLEIKCPMCGDNDPSLHMGINIANDHWYCWRDKSHRGTNPEYLIGRLLGISKAQAKLLVQAYAGGHIDDFNAPAALTKGPQPIVAVTWPDEFQPPTERYLDYIRNRGFDNPVKMSSYYNIECCQVGRWKQRLIIPILTNDMQIVGWQGRAITPTKKAPKYLTSHQQVKRSIFNLQNIKGGDFLIVCEGAFDSFKIDWYGKPRFRATCTFGVNPTLDQILQIKELMPLFKKTIVLFDSDSAGLSGGFHLSDWLPAVKLSPLPATNSDPGSMNKVEVRRYLDELCT
jgi:DNA primase catalytic core, N-terminal domain